MSMTITMDDALKAEFAEVCAEIGMSASTAFNIFAKKVVRERRIPFELTAQAEDERMRARKVSQGILSGFYDYESGRMITVDELDARRAAFRAGSDV